MIEEIKEITNKMIKTSQPNGVLLTAKVRDKIIYYINNSLEEIDKLNNIINELEKWLEERLEKLDINGYDDDVFNGIELALYKLQELKGSDSSE